MTEAWNLKGDLFYTVTVHSSLSETSTFSLCNNSLTMSNLTPPQPPPTWTHTPEEVTTSIKEFIDKDRKFWDDVGLLPEEECTFESVRLLQSMSTGTELIA